jgi:hypothetical protein
MWLASGLLINSPACRCNGGTLTCTWRGEGDSQHSSSMRTAVEHTDWSSTRSTYAKQLDAAAHVQCLNSGHCGSGQDSYNNALLHHNRHALSALLLSLTVQCGGSCSRPALASSSSGKSRSSCLRTLSRLLASFAVMRPQCSARRAACPANISCQAARRAHSASARR